MSVAFTLTGHIHNAATLLQELGLPSHAPVDALLRAGWETWSDGLLARLDGVFSLAVRERDRLVLYRDPSGLRGLYWWRDAAGAIVATARLAHESERAPRATLDRLALQEYLRFLEVAPSRTLLAGVSAVEPGQALAGPLEGALRPLACSPRPGETATGPFETAVDGLQDHLSQAVAAPLVPARRAAAFLSGGIDSTLLCALAARIRPDLTAVTVGFDDPALDEAGAAARVCAALGIAHEVLRFDRGQMLQAFDRLARLSDQPVADPAAMATVLAFEACRERFDVVLDGTGADEAVGLMPPRHVRLAVAHTSRVPRPVRRVLAQALNASAYLRGHTPLLDFDHPADTMARWNGFTPDEIAALGLGPADLRGTLFHRTFARHGRHDHFQRYSALLEAMTCERVQQALAITEAPVRFPFWTAGVNRFLRRLDRSHRWQPGRPKRILRGLLARLLEPSVWDAPKRGFTFPLRQFLVADDHALLRRHLSRAAWRRRGLLRPEYVDRLAERFVGGDARLTFRVWALVVLGAWLDAHAAQWDLRA